MVPVSQHRDDREGARVQRLLAQWHPDMIVRCMRAGSTVYQSSRYISPWHHALFDTVCELEVRARPTVAEPCDHFLAYARQHVLYPPPSLTSIYVLKLP